MCLSACFVCFRISFVLTGAVSWACKPPIHHWLIHCSFWIGKCSIYFGCSMIWISSHPAIRNMIGQFHSWPKRGHHGNLAFGNGPRPRHRVTTTDTSPLKPGRSSGCPIGRVVQTRKRSLPWLFYSIFLEVFLVDAERFSGHRRHLARKTGSFMGTWSLVWTSVPTPRGLLASMDRRFRG